MWRALLVIGIALSFGIWWWRRSYVPSFLEQHYADLTAKANIGTMAQLAAYAAPPPITTMSTGWGTTTQLNPNNPASPTHNRPGRLGLNLRWMQPTGSNQ
jgi:hypothetical protein